MDLHRVWLRADHHLSGYGHAGRPQRQRGVHPPGRLFHRGALREEREQLRQRGSHL
ncbi:unnamed protein product, partial [Effrenium voratum]